MFPVPLTFYFDYRKVSDQARPYIFESFAAAGAKHMVLADCFIEDIFRTYGLAETLQQEIAAVGMTFVDAHAPFGGGETNSIDANVMEPAARKRAILRQKLAIAVAAQMGVDTLTIHVGKMMTYPEVPREVHREKTIDFLAQLLPTAEEYGVTICIENIWYPNNTPNELNAVFKALNSPYLGFCYDAGHANLMHPRNAALDESAAVKAWTQSGFDHVEWNDHVLEDMLPNVVNCHLHDNDGVKDRHRNIGHGTVDWQHVIPLLKKAPRLKNVQSEVIPCRTGEPIAEVCAAFKKLAEL